MPKPNGHKPGGAKRQGKNLTDGSLKAASRKAQSRWAKANKKIGRSTRNCKGQKLDGSVRASNLPSGRLRSEIELKRSKPLRRCMEDERASRPEVQGSQARGPK